MKKTTITEDLNNVTAIFDFFVDNIVTIAQVFMQWPLVLVPAVAITGLIFAKAKGMIKLH